MSDNGPAAPNDPAAQIQQMAQMIQNLTAQINALQANANPVNPPPAPSEHADSRPASPFSITSASSSGFRAPKLPPPAPFNGQMSQCNMFISQCENYFRLRSFEFRTFHERIAFALSLMHGTTVSGFVEQSLEFIGKYEASLAIQHLAPGLPLDPYPFTSWSDFADEVRKHFGDPDPSNSAARELRGLKMTGTADEYVLKFRSISHKAGYNDKALIDIFEEGLPQQLLRAIYLNTREVPTQINEYQELAMQYDRQYRKFQEKERAWGKPRNTPFQRNPGRPAFGQTSFPVHPAPVHRPLPPAHHPNPPARPQRDPNAMDVDSTRPTRNLANVECFYCHNKGHYIKDCPVRPARRRDVRAFTTDEAQLLRKLASEGRITLPDELSHPDPLPPALETHPERPDHPDSPSFQFGRA